MPRSRGPGPKENPVARIGLTLDEYIDLRLTPPGCSDRARRTAEYMRGQFPMTTGVASGHLRSRGYDCRPVMLDALVEQGVVSPKPDAWTQADVDAAADHFEGCEFFVPYAAMCATLGCSYADFHRALREAAEREATKYGRHIPADDQYFVMHRTPPRGVTGEDGSLVDIKPAVLAFTLCDDIRERIERGEEV